MSKLTVFIDYFINLTNYINETISNSLAYLLNCVLRNTCRSSKKHGKVAVSTSDGRGLGCSLETEGICPGTLVDVGPN